MMNTIDIGRLGGFDVHGFAWNIWVLEVWKCSKHDIPAVFVCGLTSHQCF